jgi:uncharacterized membrane protein YeaQ/YmgE (transglycosylase-associated protein family)
MIHDSVPIIHNKRGSIMNILVWIVLGALAGWLASIVMKTNRSQGLIMDIIVGIIGAFIGGFVFDLLGIGGGVTGFNLPSFLTAFVGAIILLAILRAVSGRRRR